MIEDKNCLFCPECGKLTVEYDPYHKRFCCLNNSCGWADYKKQIDVGGYDVLTGSFRSKGNGKSNEK